MIEKQGMIVTKEELEKSPRYAHILRGHRVEIVRGPLGYKILLIPDGLRQKREYDVTYRENTGRNIQDMLSMDLRRQQRYIEGRGQTRRIERVIVERTARMDRTRLELWRVYV